MIDARLGAQAHGTRRMQYPQGSPDPQHSAPWVAVRARVGGPDPPKRPVFDRALTRKIARTRSSVTASKGRGARPSRVADEAVARGQAPFCRSRQSGAALQPAVAVGSRWDAGSRALSATPSTPGQEASPSGERVGGSEPGLAREAGIGQIGLHAHDAALHALCECDLPLLPFPLPDLAVQLALDPEGIQERNQQ